MQLSLQLSKLQGTTSYFDGNMGKVGVKSDTVRVFLIVRNTRGPRIVQILRPRGIILLRKLY
jgi:hypothetical protein